MQHTHAGRIKMGGDENVFLIVPLFTWLIYVAKDGEGGCLS